MFAHEAHERQEFDVVTCVSGSGGGQAMAVVHQCGQKIIPRRGMVKNLASLAFPCQRVFDERAENEAKPCPNLTSTGLNRALVGRRCIKPLHGLCWS